MITVNIREFRKNLANYLALIEKEPVEILKRDVVVAVLSKPNAVYTRKEKKPDVYTPPTEVEKKVYTTKSPIKSNLCPICGSFLNQYGECINKLKHSKK